MENVTQESRGKSGKSKEEILRALNRSIGDNPKNELNPELKLKMSGLNDVDCFVVDGAIIKCDQMSDRINEEHLKATDYCVLYGEYLPEEYPGQFKRDIRRLSAVQAECQTANGIRFATVKDCVCQRDVDEGKEKKASILSMGYCNLYEKSDLKILRENIDKAREHGTCYCLMNLVSEWTNSRSIEIHKGRNKAEYSPCRNTMKFYTNEGPIERLTMGATLMCTRGGKITIETSGQVMDIMDIKDIMGKAGRRLISDNMEENIWDDIIPDVKAHIRELLGIENWDRLDEWDDYIEWEQTGDRTELEKRVNAVAEYIDEIKQNNPDYVKLLEVLGGREATGNYAAVSKSGTYWGMYQMGPKAFEQINFLDDHGNWTNLAKAFGVGTTSSSLDSPEERKAADRQSFLDSEIAQEVAILFALRWDYQQILVNGDDVYLGQTINGVEVTTSGLLTAGHLVGCETLHKAFTGEITWDEAKDGNHTKALHYMEIMGGLDLDGILGGID